MTAPAPGPDADTVRAAALAAATLALVTVPTLGPALTGKGESVDRYDTAITPPGYAFAIWAPIFAGCLATAVQAAVPDRRGSAENRQIGWPLAAAYALDAGWSVAAQADRFRYTPVLLPAATAMTAVAYRRLQRAPAARESVASVSTGLLLGWTALASVVNVSAGTQLLGVDARSRAAVLGSTAGAGAAAVGLAAVVARSTRGSVPVALASAWGLATTALDGRRSTPTRLVTAAGAVTVLGTAAVAVLRRRPGPRG